MRITRDDSAGARAVYVSCYTCGARRLLADMDIDLDGPAFQAYFCAYGPGRYHQDNGRHCSIPESYAK